MGLRFRWQIAAAQGQPSILSLLLERGALLDVHSNRESGSLTPLHHSTINGHVKATELILGRGADPDSEDHDGMTVCCSRGCNGFYDDVWLFVTVFAPHGTEG